MTKGSSASAADWTGRWCWTKKHLSRPWNYYAMFRRAIDLPAKPARAVLRVSADARYVLYVNARRIHWGPARSFPQHQSYDTLDISSALNAGANTICAVVHQYGVPTFQSCYRDTSGFLVDGTIEVDGRSIPVHTPDGWLCREARAWRKDVVRLSIQLGFQEHYDASADPPDWMEPGYAATEDQGWHKPFVAGPVGVAPWHRMEPRGTPLLADRVEQFRAVIAQFSGENARGYKVAEDVYHLPLEETRKKEKSLLANPQAMLNDDAEVTVVPAAQDGTFSMVVLDLGQNRTGHIMLDIAEAGGDEIIDILYTESADRSGAPAILGTAKPAGCEEALADRYRCRPGPQRWEPFHYKGFRYATLIFRNVSAPLKLRFVGLRQVHAALSDAGSFECSDRRLNEIWRVARETLRNCMFDAYVDCPSREQAQWWGDARVQFRVNAYAFGDVSLLERGIRQVAQSQSPDGALHAHPPADAPWHYLPDYMLTWVGTLWDCYFHTGRVELLSECLPTLRRVLEYFAGHERRDGLVGGFDGLWVFLDWQDLYRADFSALLNLMYLQALRWAAAIGQVAGDPAIAADCERKAAALAEAVENYFYDHKAKVWRDGFDASAGVRVEAISQHTNALAVLLRLKPEVHPVIAKEVLLKGAASRRGRILTASPFFYAYVLDALVETGHRTEAIDIIRGKWGEMLDAGATTFWENWDGAASRCHAWSASPLYHLSQQILGVMPVDIGWKQVRIAPLPAGVESARGQVPTPLGIVRVEWELAGEDQLAVRVDIPPQMEAEFVSPVGEIRHLGPGGHEFHT